MDGHRHARPAAPATHKKELVMKRLVAARLAMVALAVVSAAATISPASAARLESPVPVVYDGQQPGTGLTPAPEPCTRISQIQAQFIKPNLMVTLKSVAEGGNGSMTSVYTVTNIGCGMATGVKIEKLIMRKDENSGKVAFETSSQVVGTMGTGATTDIVLICAPKQSVPPCWGSKVTAQLSNTDSDPSNNWDNYLP
jgi:hypothetical protein